MTESKDVNTKKSDETIVYECLKEGMDTKQIANHIGIKRSHVRKMIASLRKQGLQIPDMRKSSSRLKKKRKTPENISEKESTLPQIATEVKCLCKEVGSDSSKFQIVIINGEGEELLKSILVKLGV